ncbi:MAG: hypothetical protein AABX39_03825, partial [Nanoarchaeota archaeon]
NETAVLLLENSQKYSDAAELCKKFTWKERAVENFLTAKETKKAVEVYLGVDGYSIETTEVVLGLGLIDHLDELEKLEEKKEYSKAADKSKNLAMLKRAAQNLRLAGREQEAEELLKNSDPIKAARVWEDKGKISEAIGVLFRNEFYEEIPKMHERVGDFWSAGVSYQGQNNLEKALECFRKTTYSQYIDGILMQLGRTDELVKHWEETNNYLNLAEHFKDKEPLKAAKYYDAVNDRKTSAHCLFAGGKEFESVQYLFVYDLCEEALELSAKVKEEKLSEESLQRYSELLKKCNRKVAQKTESAHPEKSIQHYEKVGEREKVKELGLKLMKQSELSGDFNQALFYARKAEDKTAEELYGSVVEILD